MYESNLKARHRRPSGRIPADLDEMDPSPILGVYLMQVDMDELSGYDRIVVLRAHQKMASYYAAQVYTDMASVADVLGELDDDPDWANRAAGAEIRAALMLTRRAAANELGLALELTERLPQVIGALAAGRIDVRRARAIVDGVVHLPDERARAVVDRIIERAGDLTTGQLRAKLRRLCLDADPEDAKDRYECAVEERKVVLEANDEGTANLLGLDLAPNRAAAASRYIDLVARSLKHGDERRTMDQLRADVMLDLLVGGTAAGVDDADGGSKAGTATRNRSSGGVVDLVVDLETLVGLAEHPGELSGYGPVIADIARQIAAEQRSGEWRYTITDPDSGNPVVCGTTRRRPTAAQRRHVQATYRTCVFPGCRMPATDCDLDHRVSWAEGGQTKVKQLAPDCRWDHTTRHRCDWTYELLENGDHRWTSPLGHTYIVRAERPP